MSTPMNERTLLTLRLDGTSNARLTLAELAAFVARAQGLGVDEETVVNTYQGGLSITEGDVG